MSDENQEQPAAETPQEPPVPAPAVDPEKPAYKLQADVAAAIAEKTPAIRGRIVAILCEEELKKRETALLKVIGKLNDARKELSKMYGSGVKQFGRDKKPVGEMLYDKKTIDDINKKEQEIAKIEGAIAKALDPDKPDYGKVKEMGNN